MPNKCVGLWGWLFGHCFRAFETSHVGTTWTPEISGFGSVSCVVNALNALATTTSEVRCKRCGNKPNDNT